MLTISYAVEECYFLKKEGKEYEPSLTIPTGQDSS